MRLDHVKKYLTEVRPERVTFSGGEPFLYFGLLIDCIKEATGLGIPSDLVTNGFWGRPDALARQYARELKRAGLKGICITADAFHQEFVPPDAVRGGARALKAVGVESIQIIGATLVDKNSANPFDQQTKRVIDELSSELGVGGAIGDGLMWVGRAVDELAHHARLLPLSELDSGRKCHFERDDGSIPPLCEREGLEIDPDGRVALCAGVTVGDARTTPISDVVGCREYEQHPLLSALLARGARGVLELAVAKGYEPLDRYASKCHLCFGARRFLRPFYPDVLAPAQVYEEHGGAIP